MKKAFLFILFIVSQSFIAQNLTYKWAKAASSYSNSSCLGISLSLDDYANVYVSGVFTGTADFDPGPGTFNLTAFGQKDIFIMKLDSTGNFIWAKQIGGIANDEVSEITTDKSNNLVLTGNFSNKVDFDPSPSTYTINTPGNGTVPMSFICKLSSNGDFIWAKGFGDGGGTAITTDNMNNIISTGYFGGFYTDLDPGPGVFVLTELGAVDIYVTKLDSNGVFLFGKQISGTGFEFSNSIKLDGSNNIFVSGKFQNTIDANPGSGVFNLISAGGYDVFCCKLDFTGNFIWAVSMGGTLSEDVLETVIDPIGNIYLTGFFQSQSVDFDPGIGSTTLSSNSFSFDGYVWKLNTNGSFGYVSHFSNTNPTGNKLIIGTSLVVNQIGEVCVTGRYNNAWADFDPGLPVVSLPTSVGEEIFICKLNNTGGLTFAKGLVGVGSVDYSFSMAMDAIGNVYLTGQLSGALDFDPGPGNATLSPTFSLSGAAFICKFGQNCQSPLIIGGNIIPSGTVCAGQTLTMTSSGAVVYNWSNGSTNSVVNVTATSSAVYTVTGVSFNGCVGTLTLGTIVSNCVGMPILDSPQKSLVTFPNPNSGVLYYQTNDSFDGMRIEVKDLLGQTVYTLNNVSENGQILLEALPKGIYLLIILKDEKVQSESKLILR